MRFEPEIAGWVARAREAVIAEWPEAAWLPEVPEWRIALFHAAMRVGGMRTEEIAVVGQAALFVEWGLWLHEAIDDAKRLSLPVPLRVLYGDVLSSRYVRLLAEANQGAMIGRIARALETIHAGRAMRYVLYREPEADREQVFELEVDIQSALPLALAHPGSPIRPLIPRVVRYMLLWDARVGGRIYGGEARFLKFGMQLWEDLEALLRVVIDEGARRSLRALVRRLPSIRTPELSLSELSEGL